MILIFNDSCTFKVFFFSLTFSVVNLKFKWDKKDRREKKRRKKKKERGNHAHK
jgi:hypothetical protein